VAVAQPPAPPAVAWRLLGFRHVALVTIGNDTDPAVAAAAAAADGTARQGMFLRVNGAAVCGARFVMSTGVYSRGCR
jgi:hypothetical protein